MTDFTNSRNFLGSSFPTGTVDAQDTLRVEPLITPEQLKDRFLFGIPLVSYFPHPVTGARAEISDEQLKGHIQRAVNKAELELDIILTPTSFVERYPYDYNWWRNHGYLRTKKRPVTSVEYLGYKAGNGSEIMNISLSWLDMGQAAAGQINLIPIMPALAAGSSSSSIPSSTGSFLSMFATGAHWVPSLIELKYTCGFKDGMMPQIVNEYVGTVAAMDTLNMLAATYRSSSYSLSIDSTSQSQSTQGPNQFQPRLLQLADDKRIIGGKIKDLFGKNLLISWI